MAQILMKTKRPRVVGSGKCYVRIGLRVAAEGETVATSGIDSRSSMRSGRPMIVPAGPGASLKERGRRGCDRDHPDRYEPGQRAVELDPRRGRDSRGGTQAVVADVHLGYEWAAARPVIACRLIRWRRPWSGSRGCSPAPMTRLIVAGDLVESARPCRRTAGDVRRLRDWLGSRGVTLLALEGNHDRGLFAQAGRRRRPHRRRPAGLPLARELPSTAGRSPTAIGRSSGNGPCRAISTPCSGPKASPLRVSSPGPTGSSCRRSRPMPRAATS